MRVAFVWAILLIAIGIFIAMLFSVWRHQFHAPTAARPGAVVNEYVWTTVPWIILAICIAPAMHAVLVAR
jgi:heme/copper-type cytochrome/quinol oxidase subunit 2